MPSQPDKHAFAHRLDFLQRMALAFKPLGDDRLLVVGHIQHLQRFATLRHPVVDIENVAFDAHVVHAHFQIRDFN